MRKRKRILTAAALALLLLTGSGCAREQVPGEGYDLYYLAPSEGCGPALEARKWVSEKAPDPGALLAALLAGPQGEGLTSPFPRGVSVESWAWDETRPGCVVVELSEQYGGLTDVSRTLADYAIVLTLSGLPEVETVEIRSAGYDTSYSGRRALAAEEAVLLDPMEGLDKTDAER